MNIFKRIRGKYRLKMGFCPECYSSPPREDCKVCRGSYEYGSHIDETLRENWRDRWEMK